MITIYTDGGCHGNPGPGAWAFIMLENGQEYSRSGAEENTTNNRMELAAVIEALTEQIKRYPDEKKAALYTDSQYVKKGINEWIINWKKNGWRTAARKPVKNKDLWTVLDSINNSLDITWKWVEGHAGHKYNELCDALVQKTIKNS